MNTVTIFCNRQGSHLLISGKYSRIKPFRVQTNRINIYMVTVVAPYFKFLNQRYISANTPKSNEPAIYLSQRYIPNNVTLKTQKRVAFYDRCQPSARGPGINGNLNCTKLHIFLTIFYLFCLQIIWDGFYLLISQYEELSV